MKTLVDFGSKTGNEMSSFEFLRHELPVRMANIMKEIRLVSKSLQQMPSVITVENWYQQSFADIMEFEAANPRDEKTLTKFADTLVDIRNRHSRVVETMAQGVIEFKSTYGDTARIEKQINYFLDRFYTNRISIRMLINQHIKLYGGLSSNSRQIGGIDPYCDVHEIVIEAFNNARFLCERYYLAAPDIQVESFNVYSPGDKITMVYLPSHLYHMLFELFKNAMRAVVETHTHSTNLPPLKITICKGKEDLTIKISDQGGGIPHSKIGLLFQYMYTTAPQPSPNQDNDGSAPLAGYGYGLPLSRLYARYFHGDLILASIDGYGTDAFVCLKVLSDEANECLPVFCKTACKMYESDVPISDWI